MSLPWEHDDAVRAVNGRFRIVKVKDDKSQQLVDIKGRAKEKPKKIWRAQDFGYTSVPPEDSDGYAIPMGGRYDRLVYLDGGHEKYRPKNTPDGCSALFNMHGDIIRVFKDNADVVHQKKINIRIGKGYAAGESGNDGGEGGEGEGEVDDKSDEDTETQSIVLEQGEKIELEYEGSKITIDSEGKITCLAASRFAGGVDGMWVSVHDGKVHLGVSDPDGTAPNKVATDAGFSTKVFAVI